MKRLLLVIVSIPLVLLIVVGVWGALLPEEHRATRTLRTKQPALAIWDTISDHEGEPKWRSDLESVASLGEREGKPVWRENYKGGDHLTLITTESKPPSRLVRELTDIDGPFSGRWEIDISPTPNGSEVKITEIGKVSNPFFRFISKYLIGHTTGIEAYLSGLAAKFGEPPEIV